MFPSGSLNRADLPNAGGRRHVAHRLQHREVVVLEDGSAALESKGPPKSCAHPLQLPSRRLATTPDYLRRPITHTASGDGSHACAGVRECHQSATLSQPEAVASGAVGAVGVGHTLERPLVREPVCDRSPQLQVELGPARPHP
jgi:hypothetical protein